MNIEQLREICLSVPGCVECLPFDDDVPVYKVMGKMFAYYSLTPKGGKFFVNLKCNPERSIELRNRYEGVVRGYHAGDTLKWNSVYLESDIPDALIRELIDHSVNEVIMALPKVKQAEYGKLILNDKL
ncbi:MAG: MmcQ/YjbR family DNA-binding protein [Bacteroidales bacterium]|jgi:predicted DNA-binding protein (MmcQ/YjbR family)|nr:MmcQ/YjbR family DNA-binding protein [Bacteroidales bacterium]